MFFEVPYRSFFMKKVFDNADEDKFRVNLKLVFTLENGPPSEIKVEEKALVLVLAFVENFGQSRNV